MKKVNKNSPHPALKHSPSLRWVVGGQTAPSPRPCGRGGQIICIGSRNKLWGLGGWEWLVSHAPFKNKQPKQTNLERNKCKNWEEINSTTRTKPRKMMLTDNFGKINFLQSMGRLGMSSWWACSFPFPDGVGGIFCFFTPFFPICSPEFPKASPDVPKNA